MKTYFYNVKNKPGLIDYINSLGDDILWRFRIDEYDQKTREQEEKYHAMLGDIARQCKFLNETFSADDWKRLCVDMYSKDCISNNLHKLADYFRRNPVRLIPALDGGGLVALGNQTRDFPRYVAAGFIEWLYAYGSQNDVTWQGERFVNDLSQ